MAYIKKGREVLAPLKYDGAQYIKSGDFEGCLVKYNGLVGACEDGKEIVAPKYHGIDYKYPGYYLVGLNGMVGACDSNGQEIVPLQYKELDYSSHVFKYKNDAGNWVSLDITLDENVTFMKEKDGFQWRRIDQDGKVGARNADGTLIINLGKGYDDIRYIDTQGGWFMVMRDGKMGACANNGYERVVPSKYDVVSYCRSGEHKYYVVGVDNLYGIASEYGREIISPKYDVVLYMNEYEFYAVQLNGKWGACDRWGKEVVTPFYDDISYNDDSGFWGQKNNGNWMSLGVTLSYRQNPSNSYSVSNTKSGMTKEEKINAVIQILGAVADALQENQNNMHTNQPTYNNKGNVTPNYNYTPNNSGKTSSAKTKVDNTCLSCKGTGVCVFCGNDKDLRLNCSQCHGTGVCKHCHGRGYKIGTYTP